MLTRWSYMGMAVLALLMVYLAAMVVLLSTSLPPW